MRVKGMTAQDAHVAGYAVEGKGLVMAVDRRRRFLHRQTDKNIDQYIEWIRNDAPFLVHPGRLDTAQDRAA